MSDEKHTFNITRAAEELVPNKFNRNAYLITTMIGLGLVAVAFYFYPLLPDQIPLWMTKPWGEGRLAPKILIFAAGVGVLIVETFNIFLSKLWHGEGDLVQRILSVSAGLFGICMCLGVWGMIQSFFL